jgi:hypothetical protein
MITHTALRLSGLLLMGGAALLGVAIVWLSFSPVIDQVFSPGINALLLLSAILLLLSLPGMYAKQAGSAGWLGLAGHALLHVGIVLIVIVAATPFLYPSIKEAPGENVVAFVLGIALTLGLLLTGIATLRAGVYPRWSGILLLAATAGFFFDFFVAEFLPPIAGQVGSATFGLLLALALTWIGYANLSGPAS